MKKWYVALVCCLALCIAGFCAASADQAQVPSIAISAPDDSTNLFSYDETTDTYSIRSDYDFDVFIDASGADSAGLILGDGNVWDLREWDAWNDGSWGENHEHIHLQAFYTESCTNQSKDYYELFVEVTYPDEDPDHEPHQSEKLKINCWSDGSFPAEDWDPAWKYTSSGDMVTVSTQSGASVGSSFQVDRGQLLRFTGLHDVLPDEASGIWAGIVGIGEDNEPDFGNVPAGGDWYESEGILTLSTASVLPGDYYLVLTPWRMGYDRRSTVYPITIQDSGSAAEGILFDMKEEYQTHELLRIRAYYKRAGYLGDAWMHVQVFRDELEGEELYGEGGGFVFEEEGFAINTAGHYILRATIFQQTAEMDEPVECFHETFEFDVVAPNGPLAAPDVFMPDKAWLGDTMEITFNSVENAELYSFWIHGDNNDETLYYDQRETPGTLTINTNDLPGSGVYWVECDANAVGYQEGHTGLHFALLDRDDTVISDTESLYFTISAKEVQTTEDFHIIVYVPGAQAISLFMQREDWEDPEHFAYRDGPGLDEWISRGDAGKYTFSINYQTLEGEWTEPAEICTIQVTNPHGNLDNPDIEMGDRVYLHEQTLEIVFGEVPHAESYSYWIHSDDSYDYLAGESRDSAGALQINLNELPGPGVYWVECDAFARGYEQGHATVHFALLDAAAEVQDFPAQPVQYYFTFESETLPTCKGAQFVVYFPGAEAVNVFAKRNDEGIQQIEYRDGPGLDGWIGDANSCAYTLYANACFNGSWTDNIQLTEFTIAAEKGDLGAPTILVNGVGHDSTLVPYTDDHAVNIEIPYVDHAEAYFVRMNVLGDGNSFYDEVLFPEENESSFAFTVEHHMLDPGRMYEIFCGVNAEGYEGAGTGRSFLLREEKQATVTLTVDAQDAYWTAEPVTVHASAEGATALLIRANNEDHWYRGDRVDDSFHIWDQDVLIYAFATYDEEPEDWDNLDWFAFDWSAQSDPVYIYAETEGPTTVPTVTLPASVVKGNWLEFTINEDGDARQMDVYISDGDGNNYEFRRLWSTGTYLLPTANLEAGRSYRLNLCCVQSRHQWTNGPEYWFDVEAPETDQAFFRMNKEEVFIGETFVPTIYAPGADAVRIMLGGGEYGTWEGDNGTNNADWEWYFDNVGTHTFYGYASYDGGENWTEIGTWDLTVKSKGKLTLNRDGIPAVFHAGASNENVTLMMPEGAEELHVWVREAVDTGNAEDRWQTGDNFIDAQLIDGENVLQIPGEYLHDGNQIWIDVQASGFGYPTIYEHFEIPIVGASAQSGAQMVFEEGGPDDQGNVSIDQEIRIAVIPAEGRTFDQIRFYHGIGFWYGDQDEITPTTHPEWFREEDNAFVAGWTFDSNSLGNRAFFAYYKLNGDTEWSMTEPVSMNVTALGTVGAFDFADSQEREITVVRGEPVSFTFTKAQAGSEYADQYWIDAFPVEGGDGMDPDRYGDGTEVTMYTDGLPEGDYEVWGRAGKAGWIWSESTSRVIVHITAPAEKSLSLNIQKTSLVTQEQVWWYAYAPKATSILVEGYMDGNDYFFFQSDNSDWDVDDRSYISGENNFGGHSGTAYIRATATFADGKTVTQGPIAIKVTAPYGSLKPFKLYSNAYDGGYADFRIEPDANADWYVINDIWMHYENTQNGHTYYATPGDAPETGSRSFHIDDAGDAHIGVTVYQAAYGYNDIQTTIWMRPLAEENILTLPSGLQEIEEEAFEGNGTFAGVQLPNSLTSIGSRAFADCGGLWAMVVPSSVTDFGTDVFQVGNITLYGYSGSAAESYASANGIDFVNID